VSLDTARKAVASRFETAWAIREAPEPTPDRRRAFTDADLGPLQIEEYRAPGLFRDLPLVLGSIRLLVPTERGVERRHFFSITFGTGLTESRRHLVAYAEGIERYALFADLPDVSGRAFEELAPFAIHAMDTVRFAAEQYRPDAAPMPYEGQHTRWSWVYDLSAADARLVLHDAVGFPPSTKAPDYRLLDDPFSSGAAAHRTLRLATSRGLLELIERDALLLAWYLRLPLQELDVGAVLLHPDLRDMHDALTSQGIELRFFDMRVDFDVPTTLLLSRARVDRGQWKAGGRIVAPNAAATWFDAVRHGLEEILGHYSALATVAPEGDASRELAGETRPWWPAFVEYFRPRSDDPFSFLGRESLLPVPQDSSPVDPELWSESMKGECEKRGLPVLVRLMAAEAVVASGLTAVRVCVPGLLRMAPTRQGVNFGERRIDAIRDRWGAREPLNPLPHPIA
jgi:thiazole/oxazole-forming peptide maturase SagD family component